VCGLNVGLIVGLAVGTEVVGIAVGGGVGEIVGDKDGTKEGSCDGVTVGCLQFTRNRNDTRDSQKRQLPFILKLERITVAKRVRCHLDQKGKTYFRKEAISRLPQQGYQKTIT
jgi:hypothetical protein